MPRFLSILLVLWLIPHDETRAQPMRRLAAEGPTHLTVRPEGRGERLVLSGGGGAAWSVADQRFSLWRDGAPLRLGAAGPEAVGVIGWTGGAYCCWTLHVFARSQAGLVPAGSFRLGKIEPQLFQPQRPDEAFLRVPDPTLDFWDFLGGRGADIAPGIPLRWDGRRLTPDPGRMRHAAAAALSGTACDRPIDPVALAEARGGSAPPRRFATPAAAAATLRAEDWSRTPPAFPLAPATEAALLAACLVYAGNALAARDLLQAAFPEAEATRRIATERQLAARLPCSPYIATLRILNGPGAPFLQGQCRRRSRDRGAVERAVESPGRRN